MSAFTQKLSSYLDQLRQRLPDRQAALVPSHVFFCRQVDLPEKLGREETYAFLELFLEANAPFPVDQLAWGYLGDPRSHFAFLYATPRSRLKALGFDLAGPAVQIFPGFVSLFGPTADQATIRFVSQNGVLSAIHLEPLNPVPSKVISFPIEEELLTDEVLLKARDGSLQEHPESDLQVEPGLWLGEGIELTADLKPRFALRHLSASTPLPSLLNAPSLSDETLWAADLRDDAFAKKESQTRLRSQWVWKSLRAAVATALFLLFGQLVSLLLATYDGFVEKDLADLEPKATRIENKLTLADRLTRSTKEDIRPFLLMEAINPQRPAAIYYNDVRSRSFNMLEIEGQSVQGVSPVNAFADAIEKIPGVESVVNNSRTRNNQTSFEFIITFKDLPNEPEGGFVLPNPDEPEAASD
ncbi:MAG: hypothetical protein RL648_1481 [Verrucomicrobiota bacterium]|jgi:hypothetical protein